MATITTINSTALITNSRTDLNNNFANLNSDKIETSYLDTDTTLAANSDSKIATQKAVKTYVDAGGNVNASETTKGIVEEATDAEVTAGTATGGTGAKLIVTPAKLATRLATLAYVKTVTRSSGLTTKDITEASTTQNIAHGLSVAPSKVYLRAQTVVSSDLQTSQGIYDASGQRCQYVGDDGSGTFTVTTDASNAIIIYENSTNLGTDTQKGLVTVDATNIIITWTRSGVMSNAGTASIMWEAEGFTQ